MQSISSRVWSRRPPLIIHALGTPHPPPPERNPTPTAFRIASWLLTSGMSLQHGGMTKVLRLAEGAFSPKHVSWAPACIGGGGAISSASTLGTRPPLGAARSRARFPEPRDLQHAQGPQATPARSCAHHGPLPRTPRHARRHLGFPPTAAGLLASPGREAERP